MISTRTGLVRLGALAAALLGLSTGCIVTVQNSCGGAGQACCSSGVACNGSLVCNAAGICVQPSSTCGATGQACCAAAPQCASSSDACDATGRCSRVGGGAPPYSLCSPTVRCASPTSCASANLMLTGQPAGSFCTQSCTPGGACPSDPGGAPTFCVVVSGAGQCYAACGAGDSCPTGFTCATPSGSTQRVCVPGNSGPACGGETQACCSGASPCTPGLVCGVGNTCQRPSAAAAYTPCTAGTTVCAVGTACTPATLMTTTGTQGSHCTTTCSASGTCPAGAGGAAGQCILVASAGQCYQTCPTGAGCPTGSTCAMPAGTGVQVCIPNGSGSSCGAVGQACCTGSTCNAGLACNGTTCVAPPSPYEGCTGASVGAACGGGTTCQRPMIANAGPDGWCTRSCTGTASMCPNSPIAGRTFNCYVLQGAAGGQCYLDCPLGTEPCPTGTVCLMTNTMTASGVRLCMPPTR